MSDALLVTSSFLPGRGGIETYLAELCDAVAPRLAVLAAAERDGKPLPTELPYKTYPGPGSMLVPSRKIVDAIVDAAEQEGTHSILFGTPWPLALLAPKLVERGLRCASIVHGAELMVPAAIPLVRSRLARALASCELLLPVSNFTARKTVAFLKHRGHPLPRLEVLRARVDTERFRPDVPTGDLRERLGIYPEAKVILCFGRLVPRKGVDRIIEALPSIQARVPGTLLLVAGTGPEEKKLRRLAHRSKASVLFAGRVDDAEAPACYALADVFVLPVVDRWFGLEIEGLGVVLLEAEACEKPCVTGRSGGTPEAVIDSVTGYVIDASKRQDLTERVVEILSDVALASRMGNAGRAHVEESFAAQKTLAPLLEWLGSGVA